MQGFVSILAELVKLFAGFLANTLKAHWGKIVISLFLTVVFFTLLFPYGDLTSLVSKQIYASTSVATRIGNMGLALNPSPGVKLSNLQINVASPPITIGVASLYPSLLSTLLTNKPYFSAELEQAFGGNIELTLSPGAKVTDQDYTREDLSLKMSDVKVGSVVSTLKSLTIVAPIEIPINMSGTIDILSEARVDPRFNEQPEVEFNMTGRDFEFPPQSVPTMMGPLSFPKIKWSELNLKGRLVAGELIIEEGALGKTGDPMFLKIQGKIGIKIDNRGGIRPLPGAYDFNIDLSMEQSVDSVIGLLLTPIAGNYKRAWTTGQGSTYTFRAWGSNFRGPPKTQRLATF